jgi:hypothetical protein
MNADSLRISVAGAEVIHLTVAGTVPGVVPLLAAARNGPGVARLRTSADAAAIAWQAPGAATWGEWVPVPADGEYHLPAADLNCWLRVRVYTAHLVASAEAEVPLADRYTNAVAQADVTAEEAAAGDVLDYAPTLTNAGEAAMTVRAWLDPAAVGLEISADGLAWSAPTSESAAIAVATLAPEASAALHVRRTISSGAESDPRVLNLIHLVFDT